MNARSNNRISGASGVPENAKEVAFLQLLHDVTVAANESTVIEHTAQICLERICSQTTWSAARVYLRARQSDDLTISAAVWPGGDGLRFAGFPQDNKSIPMGKGDLPYRVLSSRKPEFLISGSEQYTGISLGLGAEQAGLRAAAAFPILVGSEVFGVLEFFSFQAALPDENVLTLMKHTGSRLGQVIARQHAAEDLRRAKLLAESANRAKSEFLAVMSHEIRTPMHAILGIAELLSETPLNPKQKEYVKVFRQAGTKLIELINSILDLSKIESGSFELNSIPFEPPAMLDRALELMSPLAEARGLVLASEIAPDVPRTLIGDPDRLRQVLINLIGNAVKFTERGSVVVRVESNPGGPPGSLRFSVTDTGIGIAPGYRDMIFNNFTQADSSTTRKYGGTGLGLAICKSLVELMGGQIGLSSEVGCGSTFFFTVRLGVQEDLRPPGGSGPSEAEGPAKTQPHFSPETAERTALRVLIAEDSEDNLFLIQNYLKDSGFKFDLVRNGKQAVESVMSGKYDLVLIDVQMPVMDGHSAVAAIRAWEKAQNLPETPIVAITAHAFKDVLEKSKQVGCSDHLTKPIHRYALLQAISRHIHPSRSPIPEEAASVQDKEPPQSFGDQLPGDTSKNLPSQVQELIPGYVERRQTDMAALWMALKEADYETLSSLGHQLKGSGSAYGFENLSDFGASLEQAAKHGDLEEASRQTALIADYVAQLSNA